MLITYTDKQFRDSSLTLIECANNILREYQFQGYDITLRQLYYQFVSRDLLPDKWADPKTGSTNNERSYNNIGSLINNARMAGLIDWHLLVDRTRALMSVPFNEDPKEMLMNAAQYYRKDRWEGQKYRPEVWIEKDALTGIIDRTCSDLDVPYFSCRGYTSQSAMWRAGRRMFRHWENGQKPIIFHFGDHDPSGVDMTRDIKDRLAIFLEYEGLETGGDWKIQRVALSMDQIEQYTPPPDPAKATDSRAKKYIEEYGTENAWELDALEPEVINDLIKDEIDAIVDYELLQNIKDLEAGHIEKMQEAVIGINL